MFSLVDAQDSQIERLWERASTQIANAKSLEKSAGAFIDSIYSEFEASLVLARIFMTICFKDLPQRNRTWVEVLADDRGVAGELDDETPVLSLVASRGAKTAWNDIRSSRGHVGIPLVSPLFVSAAPMMSKVLQELGVVENLVGDAENSSGSRVSQSGIQTFHVSDAAKSVDSKGRKIIHMQDFVSENNIRTVFGLGRPYSPDGRNVAFAIFFSTEKLPPDIVSKFEFVMEKFFIATADLIKRNAIFEED